MTAMGDGMMASSSLILISIHFNILFQEMVGRCLIISYVTGSSTRDKINARGPSPLIICKQRHIKYEHVFCPRLALETNGPCVRVRSKNILCTYYVRLFCIWRANLFCTTFEGSKRLSHNGALPKPQYHYHISGLTRSFGGFGENRVTSRTDMCVAVVPIYKSEKLAAPMLHIFCNCAMMQAIAPNNA